MVAPGSIVILDFGGQYAHLIARRVRQTGAFSEIRLPETPAEELRGAAGLILSGGPQSVYDPRSPAADPGIFSLGIPVLGICYGLQWMTKVLGGDVLQGKVKEYGATRLETVHGGGALLTDAQQFTVWMSHGDEAANLPPGFILTGTSKACRHAAFEDPVRKFFAVQFHPEVTHTEHGDAILKRFTLLCHPKPWSVEGYAKRTSEELSNAVGDRKVFMLVSGGVDSTVAFTLLNRVLGTDRVQGLLIDTGLMRKDEARSVRSAFAALKIGNLRIEDAATEFFAALEGITDPEEKRRRIGDTFLAVQERVSSSLGLTHAEGWMLGQGTIYPDTIETKGTAHADHIKTHHNRVAAVQELIKAGRVIEPLKDLYKDEVRILGEELGLPHEFVWRHPFPGPGLGVRILCAEEPSPLEEVPAFAVPHAVLPLRSVGVQGDGRSYRHALALFSASRLPGDAEWRLATEIPNTSSLFNRVVHCLSHPEPFTPAFTPSFITQKRADLLREADHVVTEELRRGDLEEAVWQFPVVLLPIGQKKGNESIVLRPVESQEAMTANAARLSGDVLHRMTERILKISGIDAVFLDLTNKPPATIEWE